jgi:HEAT repeat protein
VQIQKPLRLFLLALALIGALVFLSLPPSEPLVNGHPLSYWIDQFDGDGSNESPEAIQNALSAMDDRCIRALMAELNRTPSSILGVIRDLRDRWNHNGSHRYESPNRRSASAMVLGQLGSRATNAIPALEKARHNHGRIREDGEDIRGAAIAALILIRHDSIDACAKRSLDLADSASGDYRYAIFRLRTNAAPAVPVFVNALQTASDFKTKYYAAHSLIWIHRPDLSLPPLVSMLKQTNNISRSVAVGALEEMRDAAKPAWNDLTVLLNDSDSDVRRHTTNALWLIDPVAARQFGIGEQQWEVQ